VRVDPQEVVHGLAPRLVAEEVDLRDEPNASLAAGGDDSAHVGGGQGVLVAQVGVRLELEVEVDAQHQGVDMIRDQLAFDELDEGVDAVGPGGGDAEAPHRQDAVEVICGVDHGGDKKEEHAQRHAEGRLSAYHVMVTLLRPRGVSVSWPLARVRW